MIHIPLGLIKQNLYSSIFPCFALVIHHLFPDAVLIWLYNYCLSIVQHHGLALFIRYNLIFLLTGI